MDREQRLAQRQEIDRDAGPGPAARNAWDALLPRALTLAVGLGLVGLVYLLARPLALLVLAFTLAQALSPGADRLETRLPRTLGVVLIYVLIFGGLIVLVAAVLPQVLSEARQFLGRAPALLDAIQGWLGNWINISTPQLRQTLITLAQNSQETLMRLPMQAATFLFDALVVLFLSLYLLIAGPGLKNFLLSIFPPGQRGRAEAIMVDAGRAMGGYVRGAALAALMVGGLVWASLTLVGLPFVRVLALLAALGEFVPYFGPVLAAVPAVLLALSQSPSQALVVSGLYLALQLIESHIITPNVMSSQTELPPAVVVFALASGFSVGGLLGALAALPLFAALRVLFLAAAPWIRHRISAASARPEPS